VEAGIWNCATLGVMAGFLVLVLRSTSAAQMMRLKTAGLNSAAFTQPLSLWMIVS
jgi:hypothetical protein